MPDVNVIPKELVDFYTADETVDGSFKKNAQALSAIENDQAAMLAEILKMLGEDNLSPEVKKIADKYNLSTNYKSKGGIFGAFRKMGEKLKKFKEKFNKFSRWMKRYKIATIILLFGIIGLIAAIILL